MASTNNIGIVIDRAVRAKMASIGTTAVDVAWIVLNRHKNYYRSHLQSLTDQLYYGQFAPSEYYDRTGMFKNSAYCEPYRNGARSVGLKVGFDPNKLYFIAPTVKGNFASYGSFAQGGGFKPLSTSEKEWVANELEEKAHILDAFEDWFNEDFEHKFFEAIQARLNVK